MSVNFALCFCFVFSFVFSNATQSALAQSGNASTVYSEHRFEDTGPLPEIDRPGSYPVSPPASASTHPFMNQGDAQFQHHRNLIPVMPMQQVSTTGLPEAVAPQNFNDGREARDHSLGNFLGGSSGFYAGSSSYASPPGASYAPTSAPTASYVTPAPPGGGFSASSGAGMTVSRNNHFVYSYYRRGQREEKRAYSAAQRASHEKDEAERMRAASEAHYAARTAQYSYDKIYSAAKNGDPVARQFVSRARSAAMRARDDAAKAQEDAERPSDDNVDK